MPKFYNEIKKNEYITNSFRDFEKRNEESVGKKKKGKLTEEDKKYLETLMPVSSTGVKAFIESVGNFGLSSFSQVLPFLKLDKKTDEEKLEIFNAIFGDSKTFEEVGEKTFEKCFFEDEHYAVIKKLSDGTYKYLSLSNAKPGYDKEFFASEKDFVINLTDSSWSEYVTKNGIENLTDGLEVCEGVEKIEEMRQVYINSKLGFMGDNVKEVLLAMLDVAAVSADYGAFEVVEDGFWATIATVELEKKLGRTQKTASKWLNWLTAIGIVEKSVREVDIARANDKAAELGKTMDPIAAFKFTELTKERVDLIKKNIRELKAVGITRDNLTADRLKFNGLEKFEKSVYVTDEAINRAKRKSDMKFMIAQFLNEPKNPNFVPKSVESVEESVVERIEFTKEEALEFGIRLLKSGSRQYAIAFLESMRTLSAKERSMVNYLLYSLFKKNKLSKKTGTSSVQFGKIYKERMDLLLDSIKNGTVFA